LTLIPGDDIDIKGKKGSSEITAIVADIPKEITGDFLASHHVGQYRELVQNEIKETNHSIEWSLRVSQEIAAGSETPEVVNEQSEGVPALPGIDNNQIREELLIVQWALAYKIPDNEISTRWPKFIAWVFGEQVTQLTGEHKAALYSKIQQQARKSA